MNNNESIKREIPKDWLGKKVIIKIPDEYFFDQPFVKDGRYIVIKTELKKEKNVEKSNSFVKRIIIDCSKKE